MHIIVHILAPLLISLFLGIFYSKIYKSNGESLIENLKNEHIIIHLPKAYFLVGALDIVVFTIFILLIRYFPPREDTIIWIYIGFSLFILLGAFIIAYTLIWKIDIFRHENYFTYRTFFFRTHKIQYSECSSYQYTEYALSIKTFEKTLNIDSKATNLEYLVAMLSQNKVKKIIK